ncbi:hypothetical protein [Tateyamaria sp.]|uniref:hypothetical protein n=1 Tax=Tateyamaria sp. TaxID=1929288 RepID=UPI00329B0F91
MSTVSKKALGFGRRSGVAVKLRLLLAGLLCAGLAACDTPSIRTEGDTSALNVQAVTVDASGLSTGVEGRALSVSTQQLEADFMTAVSAALASKSNPEGRAVRVDVRLEQVRLAPPAERIVAGTSSATGTITVTDINSGAVVVPSSRVVGNTENFRGVSVIGLATTPSIENDYKGTVNGFANSARQALFGSAG